MVVNNSLLTATAAGEMGGAFSSERLLYAGQMTLQGMLMIFAVLGILWGVLALFKVIFARPEKKKKKIETEVKTPDETETGNAATDTETVDDTELIAILTAAVAAYMESEGNENAYEGGFRVVSFTKASVGRSWNTQR